LALTAGVFVSAGDRADAVGGNTITAPDTDGVGYFVSLALDSSGNPVVSYWNDGPPDTGRDLKVLRCDDANCAGSGESVKSPDTAGDVGYYTSLALDASGNPVVSYYAAYPNLDLKVVHCNDANCAGGDESITAPDSTGDVGYFTSLALDAVGNPVVSYYDNYPNYDLKVLHCNDANCAGGDESITSPDTVGRVGYTTSLALDAVGNPVVSYWDETNADLKVLHCNDANCAGDDESITSPDTVGRVGYSSSLALDSAGDPVVSYYYENYADLKVLHCNDVNCAGGDESMTSLDAGGEDVGQYTSLALDAAGNPVVSYSDLTKRDLKVAHCGDPTCKASGPTPTRTPAPPVGGIALDPQTGALPLAQPSGSSGPRAVLLAGVIAGATGALALGGGVYYARRRRAR